MRDAEIGIRWFTASGQNPLSGMAQHTRLLAASLSDQGIRIIVEEVPRLADAAAAEAWTETLTTRWTAERPTAGVHIDLNGLGGRATFSACLRARIHSTISYHATHRYSDQAIPKLLSAELAWLVRGHTLVALNRGDGALLAAAGAPRVCVMPHGVDRGRFRPELRSPELRAAWGAAPGAPVLLWCGRLSPEKGLETFITAARAAVQQRAETRVVVVGEGPLRPAAHEALPNAIFCGQLTGDDLPRAMASADVLAFTSLVDTWGQVVGEAMASGIAVVAFDRAAAGTLIRDGIDGVLRPTGDREGLIAACTGLLADSESYATLGTSARERSAGWSWARVAEQWITLWRASGVLPRVGHA